jgi:hypothetical protein
MTSEVYEEVVHELNKAINKHGWENTPLNPEMIHETKLVILVEEVGEVARAITYDEGNDQNLYYELIQVAAMAMAWAKSEKDRWIA